MSLHELSSVLDTCLYFGSETMTWSDAETYCRAAKLGDLAKITSIELLEAVRDHIDLNGIVLFHWNMQHIIYTDNY